MFLLVQYSTMPCLQQLLPFIESGWPPGLYVLCYICMGHLVSVWLVHSIHPHMLADDYLVHNHGLSLSEALTLCTMKNTLTHDSLEVSFWSLQAELEAVSQQRSDSDAAGAELMAHLEEAETRTATAEAAAKAADEEASSARQRFADLQVGDDAFLKLIQMMPLRSDLYRLSAVEWCWSQGNSVKMEAKCPGMLATSFCVCGELHRRIQPV